MQTITWADFEKVELRAGTITAVEDFPEARKPAYRLTIDFGPGLGKRHSSAQLTKRYSKGDLMGKQILAVVNFPPKKVAHFNSEVLVTGFAGDDGAVVLLSPDDPVPNGSKLF